jgi:hypothetical protein
MFGKILHLPLKIVQAMQADEAREGNWYAIDECN